METFKNDHKLSYLKVEDPLDSAPGSPRASTPLTPNEEAFVRAQSSGFWGAGWSWEISSCVLAIGALVGIIVVLYVFDGQSTPDWPYGITLNALISVLVTIMKAAMAFPITEALSQLKWSWFNEGNKLSDLALLDAASRGAFGAFIVLFRFIPRYVYPEYTRIIRIVANSAAIWSRLDASFSSSPQPLPRSSSRSSRSKCDRCTRRRTRPSRSAIPAPTTTGARALVPE